MRRLGGESNGVARPNNQLKKIKNSISLVICILSILFLSATIFVLLLFCFLM